MRKIWIKIVSFTLSLLILLPWISTSAVGTPMNTNIRIGLAYGSGALPGANLMNDIGSGYRFGYYDADLNFFQVGYTAETAISMVKTQNVWYGAISGGRSGYSDTLTSNIAVGCYHIQLPVAYATFEEAQAAAGLLAGGFPAWVNGTYYVRIGAYLSADEVNTALALVGVAGATVAGTSNRAISVVKSGTRTILFQFDGEEAVSLGVKPGSDDSVKTKTWFAGYAYFGGFRYQRLSGNNITVVNVVDREDYINCVLSQEMSDSWPLEALKAQAVCARSYAASCVSRHTSDGFDLCSTTHCQAYPGTNLVGDNTTRAAAETAGQYVWYNGAVAETYYSSSDGGATESAQNAWGGKLPYLIGVTDPYEAVVESKISNYHWTKNLTAAEMDQIARRMRDSGRMCATLVDIRVAETTATGNVRSITLTDSTGASWTITGTDKCRIMLGVLSPRYTISGGGTGAEGYSVNEDGSLSSLMGAWAIDGEGMLLQLDGAQTPYIITADGTQPLIPAVPAGGALVVTGSGNGHNVGMSQWGAYAMASQGKTYQEILNFYFTGVEVH